MRLTEEEIINNINSNLEDIFGDDYEYFFGLINREGIYLSGPLIVKSALGEKCNKVDIFIDDIDKYDELKDCRTKLKRIASDNGLHISLQSRCPSPGQSYANMGIEDLIMAANPHTIMKNLFYIREGMRHLVITNPMDIEKRVTSIDDNYDPTEIFSKINDIFKYSFIQYSRDKYGAVTQFTHAEFCEAELKKMGIRVINNDQVIKETREKYKCCVL